MKFIKKLASIVTVISLSVAMVASPLTANAAGASMEDSQVIKIGERIKSDSLAQDSEDWYKFTTSKNVNLWYRVGYISKDANLALSLYDSEGKEIMKQFSYVGKEQVEHIKLEPETEYYIKLYLSSGSITKATQYTLYVEGLIDQSPDSEDLAINLLSGIKFTGSIECVRDDDWYTFTAGTSKTSISLSAKYNYGVGIKAYNEDGTALKYIIVSDKNTNTLQFDTVLGETYHLCVYTGSYTDYNDKSNGQYIMTLKSGSADIKNLVIEDILNKSQDVYIFNGKIRLIKGTDYTLTVGSVKAGKATVTIKGKGNYTGTVVKTFNAAI